MFKYFYFLLFFISSCKPGRITESVISFKDTNIVYEGRVTFTADAAALMWSGTSLKINFEGADISAKFKESDTGNYYNVIIDDTVFSKFHFDTELKSYSLATGLSKGKHSLQLFKRTEWDKGTTLFYGFESAGKLQLLPSATLPEKKMEFYGNSITCGFGVEDTVNDSPVGYFENNYATYAAITARYFNVQYHCIAKTGIGITVSWSPLIMPEMYDRLNPNDSTSKWDFSKYIPDLVVINLLQNDSWLVNNPNHEEFKHRFGTKAPDAVYIVEAYRKFVASIRNKYPAAQIICMLGNMDITQKGSVWPGIVERAVSLLNDKKIFTYFAAYKNTPGHPKALEQKMLADGLIQFIKEHIQW